MWNIKNLDDLAHAIIKIAEIDSEDTDAEATLRRLHSLAETARAVVTDSRV